jgi:hypothetical protein
MRRTHDILLALYLMAKHRIAIVSMFKNEAWILAEWLDHHISVGVSHFYLIDNGSTDGYRTVLAPYERQGLVTVKVDPQRIPKDTEAKMPSYDLKSDRVIDVPVPKTQVQTLMYNRHYLAQVRAETEWVAVIDCDEYLFSTKLPMSEVLSNAARADVDTVWVPWTQFGSNGLLKQPSSVREGFTRRQNFAQFRQTAIAHGRIEGFGKSISRSQSIIRLGNHRCTLTRGVTMTPTGDVVNDCKGLRDWFKRWIPSSKESIIKCNHYAVMSKQYFVDVKSRRPGGSGRPNTPKVMDAYWRRHNTNDTLDNDIANAIRG